MEAKELNKKLLTINSREALHELIYGFMSNNLERLRLDQKYANNLVKTPIIEVNDEINGLKFDIKNYETKLTSTEDQYLYKLKINKDNDYQLVIFIDTFDERLYNLYCFNKSEPFNQYLDNLANQSLNIDHIWMPAKLLEAFQNQYASFGYSLKFDQKIFDTSNIKEEEIRKQVKQDFIEEFTLDLSSRGKTSPSQLIDLLYEKGYPIFRDQIKIQEMDEDILYQTYVYYNGKLTLRKGTSPEYYLDLITNIKNTYNKKLGKIEESLFNISDDEPGFGFMGKVIEIKFKPVHPMLIYYNVFSGSKPFKLWGSIREQTDEIIYLDAVDIHTGDKFRVEILSEFLRIFLKKGVCGNVVMRLLTNFQHYFDPNTMLFIDGENYL